jgi:hypothetical protein
MYKSVGKWIAKKAAWPVALGFGAAASYEVFN